MTAASSASIARVLVEAIEDNPLALDRLAEALAPRLVTRLHNETPTNEWLDSKEAAEHLGLTLNALHKLTAARRIPFEQDGPGCKCWFGRSELDAWRRGKR